MGNTVENVMARHLRVTMPDGSMWDVPVDIIARNRAQHYADEYGGDVQRSLDEDTILLFEGDDLEIMDWAVNEMNWSDVAAKAKRISYRPEPTADDFQEGWIEGDKEIV